MPLQTRFLHLVTLTAGVDTAGAGVFGTPDEEPVCTTLERSLWKSNAPTTTRVTEQCRRRELEIVSGFQIQFQHDPR